MVLWSQRHYQSRVLTQITSDHLLWAPFYGKYIWNLVTSITYRTLLDKILLCGGEKTFFSGRANFLNFCQRPVYSRIFHHFSKPANALPWFLFLRWKATQTAEQQDQQAHTTASDGDLPTIQVQKSLFYPHKTKRNQTLIFRLQFAFTQSRTSFLFQTYVLEDVLWHNDNFIHWRKSLPSSQVWHLGVCSIDVFANNHTSLVVHTLCI